MPLAEEQAVGQASGPERMPALFIGHGNPMNAIEHNVYTEAWQRIAAGLPRPRLILAVSAHWYVEGTRVTADQLPGTIHDFGGFPRELYEVQYHAPGSPEFARLMGGLLAPARVFLDHEWGLDHGAWSVLVHMFPEADIPVMQLSIDETLTAAEHYDLARRLRPLRDQGVLIFGSGNVVHNLHAYAWGDHRRGAYDWADRFESHLRGLIIEREDQSVVAYETLGRDAELAVPTPDHYLPLLYVLAQRTDDEPAIFPVDGFDGGSISMLGLQLG